MLLRARDIYQALSAASPEVAAHRRNLAATFLNLTSVFFRAGRLREAEFAARQARMLVETLGEKSPSFVSNQELLARSVSWLGEIRGQAGSTKAALADAKHARDLFDKLDPQAVDLGWDRAWNLANLAHLQELTASYSEADTSWRQAAGMFETLVQRAPQRLDLRSDLAYHLMQLALSSVRHHRDQEAEQNFRRTVEILQGVVAQAPERSVDRFRLAQAADRFGRFLFENDRANESETFSQIAFAGYDRLFQEHYRQDEMVKACADCLSNIATIELRFLRVQPAVEAYLKSLKQFDSLPPKLAFQRSIRETRGNVLDNLGKALMFKQDFSEAEPRVRLGLSIRQSLVEEDPREPGYVDALGLSTTHLGEILAKGGDAAEARRLLEQGVALAQQAEKGLPRSRAVRGHLREARKSLARFLLENADHAGTASVTEDLLQGESAPDRTDLLTEVASNLAECALLAVHDEKLSRETGEAIALRYAKRAWRCSKRRRRTRRPPRRSSTWPGSG